MYTIGDTVGIKKSLRSGTKLDFFITSNQTDENKVVASPEAFITIETKLQAAFLISSNVADVFRRRCLLTEKIDKKVTVMINDLYESFNRFDNNRFILGG